MKCFRCAHDIVELPPDDPARTSEPYAYSSAFVVEVLPGGPGGAPGECRATVLCWSCMHEVRPDMWLSEEGWDADKPAVPFARLPIYDHDADNTDEPSTYQDIEVKPRE